MEYDHSKIEKKWQKKWDESEIYKTPVDSDKPKIYILDMFPYPSGAGLHVGHIEGETATDIYSRYSRMNGKNVLHPMGWDSFGLPAENYAIKTGIPPVKTTADAIENFRKQMKAIGFSYDWSREIGTHTPEYYKWTQWLFLEFFKRGLVYKKSALVNWDPVDQTVLANEQVLADGTAERSGAKVIQKELEQWFFKITDFADALVDDLDKVDWPESTKINQRNWIGRSHGAEIDFALASVTGGETLPQIKVFTTRPDTLFGATYMVVAPEHVWLNDALAKHNSAITNAAEVAAYVEQAKNKTNLERQEGEKDKTGVELKGIKAINPANKKEIPIFVADYVLGGYGTGAIMAVPAHDERDYAFAQKFNIPVEQVVAPLYVLDGLSTPQNGKELSKRTVVSAIIHNPKDDTYLVLKWPHKEICGFVGGGIEEGEDYLQAAGREITEETGYTDFKITSTVFPIFYGYGYKPRKDVNCFDYEYFVVAELNSETQTELSAEDAGSHELLWIKKDEVEKLITLSHHKRLWQNYRDNVGSYSGDGILINSGQFDGMENIEAAKKIVELVGGKMTTTYKLRDWLISRQRYWGAPIPIVYDPEGKPHAIPEEHLPWLLPTDVEFKPTGTSPLGQSKELLERTETIFGLGWRPEVDTMDTFVCSSWYFFRFADPHNETEFASKEALKKWLPVDLYMGGAEHTVLHLMYARFFTKALKQFGFIDFDEPFLKLRHQGIILAEDGTKMSKSKGNVINPDDVVANFGADSLRLYEMFLGPLEAMKPWNTQNIIGVRRFLERVWRIAGIVQEKNADELDTVLNQTIKKVGDDILAFKYNTAISSMMILINSIEKEKAIGKKQWEAFLKILAPFAPHITEELWAKLGHEESIHLVEWPSFDATKLASSIMLIAVQVNGKVRATIEIPSDSSEEKALVAARENPVVAKWLSLGTEQKAIYVTGKIINFVLQNNH